MPRPRKPRCVRHLPPAHAFLPQGVPLEGRRGVSIPLEGVEAMRLVDDLGLDHEAAAAEMGVSRATLGRMLADARALTARALASGWIIRIAADDAPPPLSGCGAGRCRRRGRAAGVAPANEQSTSEDS